MDKKDILSKSFKIINERGLEDFSMRKLADVLDCKPASIYHYYQNKNEILTDLYVNIFKKFFVAGDKEYDNLEDYLFDHCKLVQKNRNEYIFLMKYRRSGFLDKKIMMDLKKAKDSRMEKMNKFTQGKEERSLITHLLIMGPISELAFFEMKNSKCKKLSDDELRELVKRICIAIRSDV